jgi:hypothetical protein
MYKLITFHYNTKYEHETETFEEILSLAMDAFNQNHELLEIQYKGDVIYLWGEIYKLIGKCVY